jgi:hypothetical protein
MKKFTRLWQLMMIVLLTSSVAIGQRQMTFKDVAEKAKPAGTDNLEQLVEPAQLETPYADINLGDVCR